MTTKADALAQEAERLLSVGAVAEAEEICRGMLARVPTHPTALMITSVVCMASARWDEAEAMLMRGCTAHPSILGFHAALGRLRLQLNRGAAAVAPLENCVLLDPQERDHRVSLVTLYQTRLFASFSPESKQAMMLCLADDTLTHSLMNKAWLSLMRLDPEGADLFHLFDGAVDYALFTAAVKQNPALIDTLQQYRFLQLGLRRFLAADVAIERGLTFLRRWFLDHAEARGRFGSLLCALARTCFFTEYAFVVAEDWSGLRGALSSPAAVALLGCYEPLVRRRGNEVVPERTPAELARLSGLSAEPGYRDLMRTLIDEPLLELAVEPTIAVLTPIADPVSRAVQHQYEENPYPRWATVGSARIHPNEAAPDGEERTILVAGCGTGREAVDAALNFPAAQVDAFDLSRVSLAYGIRKARELGVTNLTFAQADLLHVQQLPRRYDLITASGVLHHLAQPAAGLHALLGVLRPGGIVRIGLYSWLARAQVADARRWIASAGFPATPTGIREFRAAVMAREVSDPLRSWLTRSYDFYALSQCRDLVFHVQEHTFTLPEVAELLRKQALSVIHVDVKSPVHLAAYHRRFPHDPEAVSLANWHLMEQGTPAMFSGMYSLWLCRTSEERLVDLTWMDGAPFG